MATEALPSPERARQLLRGAPTVPRRVELFSSNTLFGQPGIYPSGPPMVPARGTPLDDTGARELLTASLDGSERSTALERYDDASLATRWPDPLVRCALLLLSDGPASPLVHAAVSGETALRSLRIGEPRAPGRVIGPAAQRAGMSERVLDQRYCAEHPAVVAPSIAHALCHHGVRASDEEEATLHGLLAATHTFLISKDPSIATLGTELSRRQNSLTITLLNARSPGSTRASIRCPDGPGTIPGGNPQLQCPDLWSIPFGGAVGDRSERDVPEPVRSSLGRLAAHGAPPAPPRYDDSLGDWLTEHVGAGEYLGEQVRAGAGTALGLFGPEASGPARSVQS